MLRLAGLTEWENSSVVARITQWATPCARQRCSRANASKVDDGADRGPAGFAGLDVNGARRRMSAQGCAWHLARSHGRCGHLSAGRAENLSPNPAPEGAHGRT